MGAMINIRLKNKLGLGRVSIQANDFFLNFMSQTCTSDTGGRTSLPDYGVSLPISCTSFFTFPLLLMGLDRYFRLVLYISIKSCKLYSRSIHSSQVIHIYQGK